MELLGHEEKKCLCPQLGPAPWLPTAPLHRLPDVISDSKGPNLSSSFPTRLLCLILSVKPHTSTGGAGSSGRFDFHLLHTESVPNTSEVICHRMSLSLTFLSPDFKVITHRSEQN